MTRFQRLALATTVATYLLVLLGGATRVTNSGLSCPDWPTCNGRYLPTANYHVLLEYCHRLFAGIDSFLIVGLALVAWIWFRYDHTIVAIASAAVAVLIAQIVLGGLTVTQKLSAPIVTSHLGTAMILFGVVTLLTCVAYGRTHQIVRPAGSRLTLANVRAFRIAAFISAAGMYLLLLTGAYVASDNAGTSCARSWPICANTVLPQSNWNSRVYENFSHRLVVGAVTVAMAVLVWGAARWLRDNPRMRHAVWGAFALFIAQILVGAANVISSLYTPIRVVHLGTGALMWGTLVVVSWMAYRASRPAAAPERDRQTAGPEQRGEPLGGSSVREPQEVA